MANDALDPGPNGDYPYWPRNPDGSSRMPYGERIQAGVKIDVTVRGPNGEPIGPPDYPPNQPAP
ncbi:hypothetical protein [Baekduia sp.]|jgi:hypothetical protein|uniref:hypothetical protein n=1 Tax=Baekduia sp. TaxID=2600305 RepID=UPI002E06EBB4|nr:hypothetical protein [Baekduia sp.]